MTRGSAHSSRRKNRHARRSRLPFDVHIEGAVDQKAIEEYETNHELNPQRYKMPKKRREKKDLSARSKHWDQGLTAAEKAKFMRRGPPPAKPEPRAVQDMHMLKQEVLARGDGLPRNFDECAALNDGVVQGSYPAQCMYNNMNFVQGNDFFYDSTGELRKVQKRVRFAKKGEHEQEEQEAQDQEQVHEQEQEQEQAQEAEAEEDEVQRNFLEQVGFDLKNTFDDLVHFDEVPGENSIEKIQYTFARDNSRMWSVVGTIGVFVLIICLLGAFFYFNSADEPSAAFAGGATHDDFGFARYPLIGMGD